MKERLTPADWAEEFQEFASSDGVTPPPVLTTRILSRVSSDLNPAVWFIAAKLSLIHAIVGSVTLLFCPQFGIGLGAGTGLMGVLMRYGDHACMLGCGAVFMGGSALVASVVFRAEEIRKLRKTELLLFPALAFFSLGGLMCFGAQTAAGLALFWLLGSVVGGLATFELGWMFRSRTAGV